MKKRLTLLTGALIMLTSTISSGKHDGGYLRDIKLSYTTEHLNWGNNRKAKKLNVLFIVARRGGHEVVEIVQRMDIDFNAVTTFNAGAFALENVYESAVEGTTVYEKKLELIKKLEKKYDLIVLGNFAFNGLPPEAQFKILTQVANGSGLVIIYPRKQRLKKLFSKPLDGRNEILSLVPVDGLPEPLREIPPEELLKTYQFRKGRIAILDYKANHSAYYQGMSLTVPVKYSRQWQAEYENSMLLLIRTMRWTAKCPDTISLKCPQLQNAPELDQKSQPIKISVTTKQPAKCNLKIRLRNEFNSVIRKNSKELEVDNASSVTENLPILCSGKYFLDIIATKGSNVTALGSYYFSVKSKIGQLKLKTIPNRESYEKGDKITAALTIPSPPDKPFKVIINLMDSPYGRIWYKKELTVKAGTGNIQHTIDSFYMPTIAGFLQMTVVENKSALASCEKLLFFPRRELEPYLTLSWSSVPGKFLSKFYAEQVVDKLGWRAGLSHPDPEGEIARNAAILNQRFVPYTTRIGLHNNKDKKGWTTQYSWFFVNREDQKKAKEIADQSFYNPEIRELWKRGIKHRTENLTKYGPAIYTLGDENNFSYDVGFTPSDNQEFKRFLKARYGTIADLNREWGTNYKSFSDAKHYSVKEAKEKKIFPAWFDHRLFMEKQYADIHHFLAQEIKKFDSKALVGAEGSVPGNLEHTISGLEFWGPYSNLVMDEVLRSMAPEKIRMLWWGGYVGSHGGRNQYPWPLWKDILAGTVNGNAWFSASVASSESHLGADLDFAGYFKTLLPYLQALRFGIAQLLIETPLKSDGIAVLWSHASSSARLVDAHFVNPSDSTGSFIKFCYSTGLNFEFVTESSMQKGALKNFKILFLFGASSISIKEAEMIKEFVQSGGTVVADINPGIINRFCRPVNKNQLPEFFDKIVYEKLKPPKLNHISVDAMFKGKKIRFEAKKALSTPEVPVFQVKKAGNGSVVLLNFSFASASNTTTSNTTLKSFLLSLLSAVDIKPDIEITGINTDKALIRVRSGNGFELIGILTDKKDIGKTAHFKLPGKGYIYEVDKGFIDHSDKWNCTIDKPFKLFTVFAQKPSLPETAVSSKQIPQGGHVNLGLSKLTKGTVCLLSIKDPKGNIMPLRSQVIVKDSQSSLPVHFAFNDTPGTYTLTVKDIRTGLQTEYKIMVRK